MQIKMYMKRNTEAPTVAYTECFPAQSEVPLCIRNFLEGAAKEYVKLADENFRKNVFARFSFSQGDGVLINQCDDSLLAKVVERHIDGKAFALENFRYCRVDGMENVKKAPLTEDKIKTLISMGYDPKRDLFLDGMAAELWQEGITKKVRLEVVLVPWWEHEFDRRVHTGYLRYLHALGDLFGRKAEKIGIVGPGFFPESVHVPTVPQYVELRSLFPDADFSFFDNHRPILKELQFQKEKGFVYDPLTLRTLLFLKDTPDKFRPVLEKIAENLSQLSGEKVLEGIPHRIKIRTQDVRVQDFDILTSHFRSEEERTYDILFATSSITQAIEQNLKKEGRENLFYLLEKFLKLLKVGGSLYMDYGVMAHIEDKYGSFSEKGIEYLEASLGNRLEFREISVRELNPSASGKWTAVISPTIYNTKAKESKEGVMYITTHDVTVITRTAKPAAGDPDKLENALDVRHKADLLKKISCFPRPQDIGDCLQKTVPLFDSFSSLLRKLNHCGAFPAEGLFGLAHYAVPPTQMERSIEGRQLHYWKKTDPKKQSDASRILIVGAEIFRNREFVHFIDPSDKESRLYIMSFEQFLRARRAFSCEAGEGL